MRCGRTRSRVCDGTLFGARARATVGHFPFVRTAQRLSAQLSAATETNGTASWLGSSRCCAPRKRRFCARRRAARLASNSSIRTSWRCLTTLCALPLPRSFCTFGCRRYMWSNHSHDTRRYCGYRWSMSSVRLVQGSTALHIACRKRNNGPIVRPQRLHSVTQWSCGFSGALLIHGTPPNTNCSPKAANASRASLGNCRPSALRSLTAPHCGLALSAGSDADRGQCRLDGGRSQRSNSAYRCGARGQPR